ncbi:MAG: hypothetical protein Q9225_005709 [Loekoesia sp. 1 TL-2023]
MNVAPIIVSPSQAWDGNDGPWSTFALGFGTPPQFVRVLVSTTCPQPWAVDPLGCTTTDPSNCPYRRGNQFYKNLSSTWQDKGLYELDEELNLGFTGNGNFGLDSITLGYPGSSSVTINHQLLATIATKDFYLATWGIAPRATNLTRPGQNPVTFAAEDAYPSLLSILKQENKIPSISYGYTAGARHRLKQVPASLTLGGYDASRFVSSNLTFSFADDNSRDLVVGIQSISVVGSSETLLPTPILSFVDATVSHIWLPLEACQAFERVFGITFDAASSLYLVNETKHQDLLARNATLVFTIGANTVSSPTVNISLPYAAFDLQLTDAYPNVSNATRYFPLRRAANDTQYTLGRCFLQETTNTTNNSPSSLPKPSTSRLSSGIIAAVVVDPIIILAVLGIALIIFWQRKRRATKQIDRYDSATAPSVAASVSGEHELHDEQLPPPELHDFAKDPLEMDGGIAAVEINAREATVHEMD